MPAPLYPIRQYGRQAPFSSFLPGVAGERGIPLWCFYVNRGQCIAGFGSHDKQHSIMEFCPANTAYQRVQTMGFRTWIRLDGQLVEPFADGLGDLFIGENTLDLRWESAEHALRMEVSYFIVPNESIGMLCRRARVISTAAQARKIEVLDGLSAIVPFGLSQFDLKMMGQTAKAWMMVEGFESALPYFRLRASLVDTTSVEAIEDGSFGAGAANGALLPVIVDPAVVFGWDTSFAHPEGFASHSLGDLLRQPQRLENELPCCFFGWEGELAAEGSVAIDSLYGLSHGCSSFHPAVKQLLLQGGLDASQKAACALLDDCLSAIQTHTADALFDQYCRQSYLDNLLRGGVPYLFRSKGRVQPFYLYSRKHGDLERDYNDFVVTPEYYSQGNGNFRDVLQNRRSDPRFCPEIGWTPLKPFLELIQSDGYNPLVIQPSEYVLEDASVFARALEDCPEAATLIASPFTPGALAMALSRSGLDARQQQALLCDILCTAKPEVNAAFGEGYWVDHWIYLLDLLESYLSVYPENRTALLYDRCLRWYESRAVVRPLHERCASGLNGLRQHNALDEQLKKNVTRKWLCTRSGQEVLSTPFEKLFMLCVLKFGALDAAGEAVSMEAGKPGWYDALNGLPALFGSSTAESCELWRLLHFLKSSASGPVLLPGDMAALARSMARISQLSQPLERWRQATALVEIYRSQTAFCVSDETVELPLSKVLAILEALEAPLSAALSEWMTRAPGVPPTYFTNLVEAFHKDESGIHTDAFSHQPLPAFLEGPMHALRLPLNPSIKRKLVDQVHASELFDHELNMYKVSANLSEETPELGRANAFTRGWLEHESIWLHMEYKYLLELLKNGFYDDFFRDFENALIPFQPPESYGRSVLENSSFLASSANPDPGTHGRGFVARLSGATAEFLDMWQLMFFGQHPFAMHGDLLTLSLCPTLPKRLIAEDATVSATLLGHTPVCYHLPIRDSVTPATHRAARYRLTLADGSQRVFEGESLIGEAAAMAREGRFAAIHVELEKR